MRQSGALRQRWAIEDVSSIGVQDVSHSQWARVSHLCVDSVAFLAITERNRRLAITVLQGEDGEEDRSQVIFLWFLLTACLSLVVAIGFSEFCTQAIGAH